MRWWGWLTDSWNFLIKKCNFTPDPKNVMKPQNLAVIFHIQRHTSIMRNLKWWRKYSLIIPTFFFLHQSRFYGKKRFENRELANEYIRNSQTYRAINPCSQNCQFYQICSVNFGLWTKNNDKKSSHQLGIHSTSPALHSISPLFRIHDTCM